MMLRSFFASACWDDMWPMVLVLCAAIVLVALAFR
jgi:hypothetical protein